MDSRNTDLEQVKLVAHALLDVEIQPTEFSPMIVSHPFTNTGIAALPDEQGNFTPADLLNDPTDLERWRKRVGEQIDKSKNVYQIFMLVNMLVSAATLKIKDIPLRLRPLATRS